MQSNLLASYFHMCISIHPVIYDKIDASLIRSTSLHTSGAAGPSDLDATAWRRMCTSFKTSSHALCQSLAFSQPFVYDMVDPECTVPLLAFCFIALDNGPGVRPIGIHDAARCISAKAILSVTGGNIQEAAGSIRF